MTTFYQKLKKKEKCREILFWDSGSYDTRQFFVPFVQTRKAIGMVWTVTVELEQVVHTLTSNIVQERLAERFWFSNSQFSNSSLIPNSLLPLRSKYLHTTPKCGRQNLRYKPLHFRDRLGAVRDGSKSKGGWAGAFGNVVDKKHMTHSLPLAQKWLTHP